MWTSSQNLAAIWNKISLSEGNSEMNDIANDTEKAGAN
jgi:hypothetical protein